MVKITKTQCWADGAPVDAREGWGNGSMMWLLKLNTSTAPFMYCSKEGCCKYCTNTISNDNNILADISKKVHFCRSASSIYIIGKIV